jgi:hypothetical protein
MKTQQGGGTRWKWVVSFKLRPLCPWGKSPRTHWIGGYVGLRAGLDPVNNQRISYPSRVSNPESPVFHPVAYTLYRLSYPGSVHLIIL